MDGRRRAFLGQSARADMLRVDGIEKSFAGTPALGPLSLDVDRARIVAIVGPSGCGKTTLLRTILRLVEPDAGSVSLDGTLIRTDNVRDMRRRIGTVLQNGGLFPHLDVRANVALPAGEAGWPREKIDARISELADLARLDRELLDRFPSQLSGGQQQRAALMRALVLDPGLLLLDEPLGALDPMIRFELQNDLHAMFRRLDKTVILVTHDLSEAAFFGDEVVLMQDGKIAQRGPASDLVERPVDDFVSRFVRAQRRPLEAGP
jgi:osmoprotectant transport system ATP-binding protein